MALTKITSHVIGSGAVTAASLSGITTDNVSEGSSNTYFTNARARGAVSVTGGNLSYDSSSGVIQLTTGTIRAQLSGGTGVTYNSTSGAISIGQSVATDATPTFGNTTLTGYLRGPSTFTIDPATHDDNTGTVVIAGNLQVDGTTTTINSTTLTVDDKLVTLASGSANAGAANGAGIEVDISGATNPSILYDGTNDEWDINKGLTVDGIVEIGSIETSTNFPLAVKSGTNDHAISIEEASGAESWQFGVNVNGDLGFYNSGSTTASVTFDDASNVGIGEPNPDAPLHITSTTPIVVFDESDASQEYRIGSFGGAFALYDSTDAAYRLVVDGSGKVGIGTVSPDGNLEVVASSVIDSTSDTVNNVLIGLQSANRPTIVLDTADTTYTNRTWNITNVGAVGSLVIGRHGLDVLNLKNDGKVGIGTTAPDLTLHIDGTNAYPATSGTTPNGMLHLRAKTAGGTHGLYMGVANASPWGSWLQAADANNLATEYPLLLNPNGGDVGVNVTAPTHSFHAYSTDTGAFLFDRNSGNEPANLNEFSTYYSLSIKNRAGGTYLNFGGGTLYTSLQATDGAGTAAAKNIILNPYGGNVGIGTIGPDSALHVHGVGALLSSDSYFVAQIQTDRNDDGSNDDGILQFVNGSSKTVKGEIRFDESTNTFEFSHGDNQNHLLIGSGGDIGIGGVTNPSGLEVYSKDCKFWHGNTTYYTMFQDQNEINTYDSAGASSTMYLQHNGGDLQVGAGTTMLYFDRSAGGVGVGLANPDSLLHVKGTNNSAGDLYTAVGPGNAPGIMIQNAGTTDNNNATLFFKNDASTVASVGARFISHSTEETQLRFSATDSSGNTREKMFLTGDGKLGLGVAPGEMIHTYVGSGSNEIRNDIGSQKFYMRHGVNRNSAQGTNVFDFYALNNQDVIIGTGNDFILSTGSAVNSDAEVRMRVNTNGTTVGPVSATATSLTNGLPRRLWVKGGGVFHSNSQSGNTTPKGNNVALLLGPGGTRSTATNAGTVDYNNSTSFGSLHGGIAWDHLLNYSSYGNVGYHVDPHGWLGMELYDTPGYERSNMVMCTRPGTGASDTTKAAMRWMATGEITTPRNPAFSAYGTGLSNQTTEGNHGSWTENFDRGGNYVGGTTNVFTAPVDGLYFFYAHTNFNSGSSSPYYWRAIKNNGGIGIFYGSGVEGWEHINATILVQMDKNDTFEWKYKGDPDEGVEWAQLGGYLVG